MDYKTQQQRALPLLATAYAFVFVGQWMNDLYTDLMARIRRGDLSTLSEVHAASAGLKSLTTSVTAVRLLSPLTCTPGGRARGPQLPQERKAVGSASEARGWCFLSRLCFFWQNAFEECRKLCGGHGYLCASGLPQLYATYVPACTYEGDNWVLLLQVCGRRSGATCFAPG